MAKTPKDHLDEKSSVLPEPEFLIAQEQLG
jgi:hypothetical protein